MGVRSLIRVGFALVAVALVALSPGPLGASEGNPVRPGERETAARAAHAQAGRSVREWQAARLKQYLHDAGRSDPGGTGPVRSHRA